MGSMELADSVNGMRSDYPLPTRLTQGTPFAKCTVFSRENYT
jgi:hypothetical protein